MNPRIFVLALSTFAFGSAAFIFAGLLERMAADIGVSTAAAGQLQTTYVIAAAFVGPPLAFLLGKRDRKRILLIALTLAVLLNLGCAFSDRFEVLAVLRVCSGMVAALAGPAASSAAGALAPLERRGSAMAIVSSGMTLAFLLGIPMGSVVGAWFGWRATFLLAAGLAAFALIAIALVLPSVRPQPNPPGFELRWRRIIAPLLATFLGFGANMQVSTYIATVVRVQTGVEGAGIAAFQMVVGIGSIFGLSLGARLADRGRTEYVTLSLVGIAGAALLHLAALHHLPPAGWPAYALSATAFVAASTALFSVGPMNNVRLVSVAGPNAPFALALSGSAASMGQALGAAVGGALLAGFGAEAIPLGMMSVALIGALLFHLAAKKLV